MDFLTGAVLKKAHVPQNPLDQPAYKGLDIYLALRMSSTNDFKLFLQKYAFKDESASINANNAEDKGKGRIAQSRNKKPTEESPPKKARISFAPAEVYAHLNPLVDIIAENLDILFVGINPGVKSASSGHHFAGRNNAFWPGLYKSGLLKEPMTPQEDASLPAKYNYGITNLVQRPSRSSSELSKEEVKDAVPSLLEKIKKYHPTIVCFIGKGIFEIFAGRKCTKLGLQPEKIPCEFLDSHNSLRTKEIFVFAMPSTSARTSTYQFKDKLKYFIKLKDLLDLENVPGYPETIQDSCDQPNLK
ncbi:DNA glycosylase [Basidiobolus meristosporus CBS 931.73]|uniref:G/T mismatch-specific thymine DNA glycosylase n=1 Tax=Basidiobolus meristosporus CBS 931.73 TaxID=1314790 RepID=A0A1Y1X986_9FUNG|nr:DNA glycosylase [Basidiobolus meristosporus CBS 931.73]|eukprot:ORX82312.1 DNA glycosylase [Basidiobolus meristosporus CBS 931.73]